MSVFSINLLTINKYLMLGYYEIINWSDKFLKIDKLFRQLII